MLDFLLGNDALSTLFAFLLVLIPAVLIHELGHFFAAKLVGITILEFGIGMPPRALKLFTLAGTDYTLNWLPLGGFVRPLGEDIVRPIGDEAMEKDKAAASARGIRNVKSVNEAKPLPRIFFMAGGALANFISAFVLFIIIALMGLPTVTGATVNVLYADPQSALGQAGIGYGDMIETVNGEQFPTSLDFFARLNDSNGEPLTLSVSRADAEAPVDVTVTPDAVGQTLETNALIVGIADNSPASAVGLQLNDVIKAFNGEPVTGVEALQAVTVQHLDQLVVLTIERAGETFDVELTPRSSPPDGQGAMGISISGATTNADAGLVYQEGFQQALIAQPLGDAVQYSLDRISLVVTTIVSLPGQILSGQASGDETRLASPLGISQVGAVFLQESIERNQPGIILEYVALISLALGLTNLLPIPALDGGRILFVIIEILRGRPVAPEREGMVHLVGMVLLLSMMAVVLLNDIVNPLSNLIR